MKSNYNKNSLPQEGEKKVPSGPAFDYDSPLPHVYRQSTEDTTDSDKSQQISSTFTAYSWKLNDAMQFNHLLAIMHEILCGRMNPSDTIPIPC